MKQWRAVSHDIWQGRDDTAEAANALRLFQTVARCADFAPQQAEGSIALLGFACDEGVKRNRGRPGAAEAPDVLRQALANMASHAGHRELTDLGNIVISGNRLEEAQQALRDAVLTCQQAGKRTLVLGGGHETAYGHGLGVLDAFPQKKVGIINLDAHLDLRHAPHATSGTPFRQLAHYCETQQRDFHYGCFGLSMAANTQALLDEAAKRNVTIVEDLRCLNEPDAALAALHRFMAELEVIYLTVDLDVLPASQMPAVSAPAALGVPAAMLMRMIEPICRSGKLRAADLVEFNPACDRDKQGASLAARIAWQITHWWG
ncbi:formimidoylglutamase [Mixta calida]|uniref:formimidoylglutamase n=1 Tax=Mixta calida TaxID=665913 RepID=UPI0028A1092C|nr:formimidoylglutamase [Mixta calida]MBS6059382.1 formimidoylglutamase [Pantoea sp.]MDU4291397.1 formimidoylglutamase [Mixta calida]MDU5192002.1 formimidoylglutamase [Mixta calida]MDU6538851.1 formimidoylglutamase [Mixta calida]